MSSSLTPAAVEGEAVPYGRFGLAFGSRFMLLLVAGLMWVGPAFLDARFLYGIVAWDTLVLLAYLYDLSRLPGPRQLSLCRIWHSPAALSETHDVELRLINQGNTPVVADVTDDVPAQLRSEIPQVKVTAGARSHGAATYAITPSRRGDTTLGDAYLHYQSPLHLAERWARVPLQQTVRVYPTLEEAKQHAVYMVRSRQIEMQRRYTRMRGTGREFESLREYREGDELRNICWTATARRGKLVTRTFQVERSQTIWVVLDCGRLMRTRVGTISKLDAAVNTALALSEVSMQAGDRIGLLAYGRSIQQRLLPGRGNQHLRHMLELLADVREEIAEADHLRAASALMSLQRRRSLVVWITDLAETAMTPEVMDSAMLLLPQQLVLLAVIGQPDLARAAVREPRDANAMFQAAAAQEMMHRRETLLARVQERGALAVEIDSAALSSTVVNAYLEIKQRNRL